PARQLAGDSSRGHGVALVPVDETYPSGVQTPVACIPSGPGGRGCEVPPITDGLTDGVSGPMMPGGLYQQPAHVSVAGLGDGPLGPGLARGMLAGDQSDEGCDGGAGEAVPVANLDRQSKPGQAADPAQAPQPACQRGELAVGGHVRDLAIEA